MTTKEQNELFIELFRLYRERFGEGICVPIYADDFNGEDFIEEMQYSLETGIPFDQNSPRWRWGEVAPPFRKDPCTDPVQDTAANRTTIPPKPRPVRGFSMFPPPPCG